MRNLPPKAHLSLRTVIKLHHYCGEPQNSSKHLRARELLAAPRPRSFARPPPPGMGGEWTLQFVSSLLPKTKESKFLKKRYLKDEMTEVCTNTTGQFPSFGGKNQGTILKFHLEISKMKMHLANSNVLDFQKVYIHIYCPLVIMNAVAFSLS